MDAAHPGQVLADRQMALTILRNLVSNAVQATPAGGRITIRATDEVTDEAPAAGPRRWRFEVADTGHGMSAEELAGLSGSAGAPAAGARHGRAGLGLRLSRQFVQAQGGRLSLCSTEGRGTTATLELPAAESPPARPQADTPNATAHTQNAAAGTPERGSTGELEKTLGS